MEFITNSEKVRWKETIKQQLAAILPYGIIKKAFLKDVFLASSIMRGFKHKNGTVIKRRNRDKETVYKEAVKNISFWLSVLEYKKNHGLLELLYDETKLRDKDNLDLLLEVANDHTTYKVSIRLNYNNDFVANTSTVEVTAKTFMLKELARIKKRKEKRLRNWNRRS